MMRRSTRSDRCDVSSHQRTATMNPARRLGWLIAGLLVAGCAGSVVVVDGIEVYESHWMEAQRQVGPRASFELDCPEEQLQFRLFRREGRAPSEVGAEGCGRREVYTRVGQTWFSSGQRAGAEAQRERMQPPPPMPPPQKR